MVRYCLKSVPLLAVFYSVTSILTMQQGALATDTYLTLPQAQRVSVAWGKPGNGVSVGGNQLRIGGVAFAHGIGLHVRAELVFLLDGSQRWLTFCAGVDSEVTQKGAVTVQVLLDGRQVYQSPVLRFNQKAIYVSLPLKGAKELRFVGEDAGPGHAGHFDLCNLRVSNQITEPKPDGPVPINGAAVGEKSRIVPSLPNPAPASAEPYWTNPPRPNLSTNIDKTKVPVVDGDYVLIYKPQPDVYRGHDTKNYRNGATYKDWQPNDHTFIKGPDKRWHLFGITRPNDVKNDQTHEGEGWCFHAVAPVGTLEQVMRPTVWSDQPKLNISGCGWAPVVVKIGDAYSIIGSGMGRAESKNLYKWEDKGRLAVQGGNRDPNITFWSGTYYLVRCDNNAVSVVTSTDFVHWTKPQEIFKPLQRSWNCESPTLLHHEGKFYLFWCLWDSSGSGPDDPPLPAMYKGEQTSTYNYRTYVYASDTPTDFHGRPPVAELKAHAPEIVQDEKGNWFVSSVDYPQRGVSLAHLTWR